MTAEWAVVFLVSIVLSAILLAFTKGRKTGRDIEELKKAQGVASGFIRENEERLKIHERFNRLRNGIPDNWPSITRQRMHKGADSEE